MENQKLEDGSGDGMTYAQAFYKIGKSLNLSPYFLAARVRQEQGLKGSSALISGTHPGFEGCYNYFNIGASGPTKEAIYASGLTEARNEGWTSRYAALEYGAKKVAANYISKGQDALYLQKFNVVDNGRAFWGQYMQNLLAADNEGKTMRKAYANINALENSYAFKIPVYQGMPVEASPNPDVKN